MLWQTLTSTDFWQFISFTQFVMGGVKCLEVCQVVHFRFLWQPTFQCGRKRPPKCESRVYEQATNTITTHCHKAVSVLVLIINWSNKSNRLLCPTMCSYRGHHFMDKTGQTLSLVSVRGIMWKIFPNDLQPSN